MLKRKHAEVMVIHSRYSDIQIQTTGSLSESINGWEVSIAAQDQSLWGGTAWPLGLVAFRGILSL